MLCSNCGKEVEDYKKFCSHCGYKVRYAGIDSVCNYIKQNKRFVILITSLFLCVFFILISFFFFNNSYINCNGTYKSIVPISQTKISRMNTTALLKMAIHQEKDLDEVISKLSAEQANALFETFYNNLSAMVEKMSVDDLNIESQENGTYKLTPNTKLIHYEVNDWTGIWINHEYLNKKYSKYLSDSWKKFLELTSKDTFNKVTIPPRSFDMKDLVSEIIAWQKFISEYPDFSHIDIAKSALKDEVTRILWHEYIFQTDDGSMRKEYRAGYEEFLKKVNKNCAEYKVVKDCYDELKKNYFLPTEEYYQYVYEYCQYDWVKEYWENSKEYLERIQQIIKLKKLKFDKQKLLQLIEEGDQYYQEHKWDKDECGNYIYSGSGSYGICISEYIQENDKNLYDIYQEIKAACWLIYSDSCNGNIDEYVKNEIKKH